MHRLAQEKVKVKVQVIENDTHQITPVMVCIIGTEDGKVRIPPLGEIPKPVNGIDMFFKGIEFNKDKNWIGPLRNMNNAGKYGFYSFAYKGLSPIPYWSEPAMYQTSGDFTIDLAPGKWRISLEHGNEYILYKRGIYIVKQRKGIN